MSHPFGKRNSEFIFQNSKKRAFFIPASVPHQSFTNLKLKRDEIVGLVIVLMGVEIQMRTTLKKSIALNYVKLYSKSSN
jgi:hypothetical protein